MSEKEIILERIQKKQKMLNAGRQMTHLFILTSALIFFTFIVVWLFQNLSEVNIPTIYKSATWFILVSSALIILAQLRIREDEIEQAFRYTGLGLFFGLLFSVLQAIGWNELMETNLSFRNILFPFSLVHFLHVSVGLFLLITVFRKIREYRVHSRSRQYAFNVFLFWHFLGIVWVCFVGLG
ncbi:MAG: cytochrome c oxidase subunit 3 [Ekhidna sp.]